MKILVTGGAGFIGSNYVRRQLADAYPETIGAEVTVLDKLTYAGTLTNLEEVADSPRYRFLEGDICDPDLVNDLVPGHDAVVHFAAESHVDRSITGASDFVVTNVLGTQTLLQAALNAGIDKFVHVSTDEVYGSIPEGSWDEKRPLEPNSPYSASKAGSDLLARAYARTFGMEVCITRCSNNYGPHQFPEKVIPLFVTNLMDGLQVPLYGEGLNVRDWLHVDDHCRGINLVLAKGRAGETYNIGGGTELTNVELTERLLAAMGVGWEMVRHVEDRKGHDLRYSVDITKIADELGLRPRGPVRAGPGGDRRVVQVERGMVASAQGSEARAVSEAASPDALAGHRGTGMLGHDLMEVIAEAGYDVVGMDLPEIDIASPARWPTPWIRSARTSLSTPPPIPPSTLPRSTRTSPCGSTAKVRASWHIAIADRPVPDWCTSARTTSSPATRVSVRRGRVPIAPVGLRPHEAGRRGRGPGCAAGARIRRPDCVAVRSPWRQLRQDHARHGICQAGDLGGG